MLALKLGVDLYGVADLQDAYSFILRHGENHIGSLPKAISIAIRLLDAFVDELHRHEEASAIYTYRGLYNSVNASLDRIGFIIAKRVQEKGFQSIYNTSITEN